MLQEASMISEATDSPYVNGRLHSTPRLNPRRPQSALPYSYDTRTPDGSPPVKGTFKGRNPIRLLRINVCGAKFEVPRNIFSKHPESLLGDAEQRKKYFNTLQNEYFLNRSRTCFEAILEYYQTGTLRRPQDIALDRFVSEVTFYKLKNEALLQLFKDEGFELDREEQQPTGRLRRIVWQFVDVPTSSWAARIFGVFSVLFILISIASLCAETIPEVKNNTRVSVIQEAADNATNHTFPSESRGYGQFVDPFFIIESVCVVWFTLEFAARLLTCPNLKRFSLAPMNVFDLLAIVPYYIDIVVRLVAISNGRDNFSFGGSFVIMRVVRLIRVFRIFKLSRYSKGLQILGRTFSKSLREFGLLLLFLSIGVVLFSSAVFYAELGVAGTQFTSIPQGFWWAIVTMTTVGYGDIAPVGLFGRIIGSLCAVSGVVAVALPVPVIVNNFNTIYQRELDRPKVEKILKETVGDLLLEKVSV